MRKKFSRLSTFKLNLMKVHYMISEVLSDVRKDSTTLDVLSPKAPTALRTPTALANRAELNSGLSIDSQVCNPLGQLTAQKVRC